MIDDVHIQGTNPSLPFYGVVIATAQYLKTLEFMQPFNGAIYTYSRLDNPNTGIPAVFISFSNIQSNRPAERSYGTMRIDVMINPATSNRENQPIFKHDMMERLVQSTLYDSRYKMAVTSSCPYLSEIGKQYNVDISDNSPSFRLTIGFSYFFASYQKWIRNIGFDASGENRISAIIKEIDTIGGSLVSNSTT